jgi:hypothetical protein
MTQATRAHGVALVAALILLGYGIFGGGCLGAEQADKHAAPATGLRPPEFAPATVLDVIPEQCQAVFHQAFCTQETVLCDPFVDCPARGVTMADDDGDCVDDYGIDGPKDTCPLICDPTNADTDGDSQGDVCDVCPGSGMDDNDNDGICEDTDNCPGYTNPTQADADGDGRGDACDQVDGDPSTLGDERPAGWADLNCNGIRRQDEGLCLGLTANLLSLVSVCTSVLPANRPCDDYADTTPGTNTAAVCNATIAHDLDLDGWGQACDNCPEDYNPGQANGDADALGDACDPTP